MEDQDMESRTGYLREIVDGAFIVINALRKRQEQTHLCQPRCQARDEGSTLRCAGLGSAFVWL